MACAGLCVWGQGSGLVGLVAHTPPRSLVHQAKENLYAATNKYGGHLKTLQLRNNDSTGHVGLASLELYPLNSPPPWSCMATKRML